MKKTSALLTVVFLAIFCLSLFNSCGGSNINKKKRVTGYSGYVESVDGNTLKLKSGLKVYLLGVASNGNVQSWLQNHVVGKTVTLVADSKNQQTFMKPTSTVRCYAIIKDNGWKRCVNRLVLEEMPEMYSKRYINDSTFGFTTNSMR